MSIANKIVVGLVGLTVMAVIFSAMLPIMGEVTSAETTFTNEGYYTMDKLTADTDVTIKWAKDNLNIVTVNDTDIDMSLFVTNGRSYTLIGSDSFILRYQKNNSTFAGVQVYSSEGYLGFHSNSSVDFGNEITLTVQNNTVVATSDGTSPLNQTFSNLGTDGYIINPSGTGSYAIMKKADVPAYVLGNSDIRLIGVSVSEGPNGIALYGAGTIDDGIEISTIYKPNTVTTVSYSEPVVTDNEVSGYIDLYQLDKYEFTITYDTNTFDATYSYFIVPVDVTAEKSAHPDGPTTAILNMLPIIVGAGLLLGAIAFMIVKRK